jgi:hypothetical protein
LSEVPKRSNKRERLCNAWCWVPSVPCSFNASRCRNAREAISESTFLDLAYFLKLICLLESGEGPKRSNRSTLRCVRSEVETRDWRIAVRYYPTETNCVPVEFDVFGHCPTLHGDVVFQVLNSFVAQSVDLSVWQDVQGLGILYLSVIDGEMNLKVCELTKVPGTPSVSI